jgi:hypothetical protein
MPLVTQVCFSLPTALTSSADEPKLSFSSGFDHLKPSIFGAVAQLGERRVRNAKVEGSTPFRST